MSNVAEDVFDLVQGAVNQRRRLAVLLSAALVVLLVGLALLSMAEGAVAIPPGRVVDILLEGLRGQAVSDRSQDAVILLAIRLPRVLLGCMVGAGLAVSGALMQGLFRNPLADPGLVGVSAGAGLGATLVIVLGARLPAHWIDASSFSLLPIAAFVGALATTSALYLIATRAGRTSVSTMLLAGIAVAALASSVIGLLTYLSDDRQLRDIAFWSLGSLGGATWAKVKVMAPLTLLLMGVVPFLARGLNAIMLGEGEAFHLGISVQSVKIVIIFLVAVAVGASVAAAGVISFVGIVIPHLLRLMIGPDHRLLLPLSAIAGASLIVGADILARTLVAPAELPIGILTAAVGAPFFLWLLLQREQSFLS